MTASEQTRNLESVWYWGEDYLRRTDEMLGRNDVYALEEFQDELWSFVTSLKKRWIQKRHLRKPKYWERMLKLYDDLRTKERLLNKSIMDLDRDRDVLTKMEDVALPEGKPGILERVFANWKNTPTRYNPKTMARAESAKIPSKDGR